MTIIYEKVFQPKEPRAQFSSCCGASDKGLDGYVGCRACHEEVLKSVGLGGEESMRLEIKDPEVRKRFEQFLAEPSFESFRAWHDWKLAGSKA